MAKRRIGQGPLVVLMLIIVPFLLMYSVYSNIKFLETGIRKVNIAMNSYKTTDIDKTIQSSEQVFEKSALAYALLYTSSDLAEMGGADSARLNCDDVICKKTNDGILYWRLVNDKKSYDRIPYTCYKDENSIIGAKTIVIPAGSDSPKELLVQIFMLKPGNVELEFNGAVLGEITETGIYTYSVSSGGTLTLTASGENVAVVKQVAASIYGNGIVGSSNGILTEYLNSYKTSFNEYMGAEKEGVPFIEMDEIEGAFLRSEDNLLGGTAATKNRIKGYYEKGSPALKGSTIRDTGVIETKTNDEYWNLYDKAEAFVKEKGVGLNIENALYISLKNSVGDKVHAEGESECELEPDKKTGEEELTTLWGKSEGSIKNAIKNDIKTQLTLMEQEWNKQAPEGINYELRLLENNVEIENKGEIKSYICDHEPADCYDRCEDRENRDCCYHTTCCREDKDCCIGDEGIDCCSEDEDCEDGLCVEKEETSESSSLSSYKMVVLEKQIYALADMDAPEFPRTIGASNREFKFVVEDYKKYGIKDAIDEGLVDGNLNDYCEITKEQRDALKTKCPDDETCPQGCPGDSNCVFDSCSNNPDDEDCHECDDPDDEDCTHDGCDKDDCEKCKDCEDLSKYLWAYCYDYHATTVIEVTVKLLNEKEFQMGQSIDVPFLEMNEVKTHKVTLYGLQKSSQDDVESCWIKVDDLSTEYLKTSMDEENVIRLNDGFSVELKDADFDGGTCTVSYKTCCSPCNRNGVCEPEIGENNENCVFDCPTCSDGVQNGDEEGIDCGGAVCEPCPVPPEPTCVDEIKNGDEEGIDCGGSCPPCSECARVGVCCEACRGGYEIPDVSGCEAPTATCCRSYGYCIDIVPECKCEAEDPSCCKLNCGEPDPDCENPLCEVKECMEDNLPEYVLNNEGEICRTTMNTINGLECLVDNICDWLYVGAAANSGSYWRHKDQTICTIQVSLDSGGNNIKEIDCVGSGLSCRNLISDCKGDECVCGCRKDCESDGVCHPECESDEECSKDPDCTGGVICAPETLRCSESVENGLEKCSDDGTVWGEYPMPGCSDGVCGYCEYSEEETERFCQTGDILTECQEDNRVHVIDCCEYSCHTWSTPSYELGRAVSRAICLSQ